MLIADVKGFDNYIVYSDGTIFSKKRKRFLNGGLDTDGYRQLVLCQDGKRATKKFHRLVAEHFLDNPDNLPVVNHKDGCKENNDVSNLEWCTISHNTKEAYRLGFLSQSGERNNGCKYPDLVVNHIVREYASGSTIKELSNTYGIKYTTVYSFVKGLRRGKTN